MQSDLTNIVKKLNDLACRVDCRHRETDYFRGPSRQVTQIREIAADLCLLSSLRCSMQNGNKIISRLRQHGEQLETISGNLERARHKAQIRKIIFELINETPVIMTAMINTLPKELCLTCDENSKATLHKTAENSF